MRPGTRLGVVLHPERGRVEHPEASPGPHDIGYLFDRFAKLMEGR